MSKQVTIGIADWRDITLSVEQAADWAKRASLGDEEAMKHTIFYTQHLKGLVAQVGP